MRSCNVTAFIGKEIVMSKTFVFVPYKRVGSLEFGMKRSEISEIYGECKNSSRYGYPVEDGYMDNYGYMHTLCDKNENLEAVELLPFLAAEELNIEFGGKTVCLSVDIDTLVESLEEITDDLVLDDDEEGYTSVKLGLRVYCPEDEVEDIIIHDRHYYDE